uniref:Rhophilin Rho GTPase binding protein 2 n=1 Tax=Anolis carolinensis TaxID=28377 RepID=A0A803TQ35_ANOCA
YLDSTLPYNPERNVFSVLQGCNPLAETGRSKLQNQRAVLNQQILKAVRMRAGAENLLRATTNNKVREQVLLELSFVNSDLQILKEELEGLNISVEVYQNTEPLLHNGLKSTPKCFVSCWLFHVGNNPSQCVFPCVSPCVLFINFFFFPNKRYDCFTGVPVCQNNLLLEKASILFNIGALYTQIGTRCNRQTAAGLQKAIDAFQKAAGVLNYLKETFTHTPSYDMSPAMLSVLTKMMLAQAQECVFEQICLPGIRNEFFTLVKMAQEASKVGETYLLVNIAMNQAPVKENIPYSWSKLVQVKSDHFGALAHYFSTGTYPPLHYIYMFIFSAAVNPHDDEDQQEKAFSQLYDRMPEGLAPLAILRDSVQRKQLGKSHLKRAIVHHEEALRVCSMCRKLRNIEVLQEILSVAHKRSLLKYSQQELEDDFLSLSSASDILPKTDHKVETIAPQFSKVKVKDFFEKLGPLAVFSAKQRWTAPRTVRFRCEAGNLGFTLKGGPPVHVYCLDPACLAAVRQGDCLVAVEGADCKWLGVSEVLEKLRNLGDQEMEIQVISCQDTAASLHNKSATYSVGMQKTYSLICLAMDEDKNDKAKKTTPKLSFLSWGMKNNRQKAASTLCLPSVVTGSSPAKKKLTSPFTLLSTDSSLY